MSMLPLRLHLHVNVNYFLPFHLIPAQRLIHFIRHTTLQAITRRIVTRMCRQTVAHTHVAHSISDPVKLTRSHTRVIGSVDMWMAWVDDCRLWWRTVVAGIASWIKTFIFVVLLMM